MAEPYIGEIRIFAGNFAPRGWAFCNGALMAVSQWDALYSLLGTIYGGDGRTTFGLPDMRGRIPVHTGTGPGLTARRLGSRFGNETVTITPSTMASHNHEMQCSQSEGTTENPVNNVPAGGGSLGKFYSNSTDVTKIVEMQAGTLVETGGGEAHNNIMPSLCLNFIIALTGIYPSRP